MAGHRDSLPQLGEGLYLTDGGLETTLIFHEGLDLPDFAAFHLLQTPDGEAVLRKYFRTYADIAKRFETGLILESATWRANLDWGTRLGYTPAMLDDVNRKAVHLLEEIRLDYETERTPVVVSGCVAGDPVELGLQYLGIRQRLSRLNVMGGCCGTDHRHVQQIAEACSPIFRRSA